MFSMSICVFYYVTDCVYVLEMVINILYGISRADKDSTRNEIHMRNILQN